jgi:uncharacterized membrane protein
MKVTKGSTMIVTDKSGAARRRPGMTTAATVDVAQAPAVDQRGYRLTSIDMLRGGVIVIMALDHVRDMLMTAALQDPMTDPNVPAALFLTRWITHFCAPVFVLLAGVSAGLMVARRSRGELGLFLLTRGLWLILAEWFLVATAATFAPRGIPELGGSTLVFMQVLWAIGASMLVLAAAQLLGRRGCLAIGVVVVCAHNLLDAVWPASGLLDGRTWPLWVALHSQMSYQVGPFLLLFIYPVVPWIGVMLVGFGVSPVFEWPAARRNRVLLRGGAALTAVFLVLRGLHGYGEPNPWQIQPAGVVATVIDFLNTTKYPPSLGFLLMTLGPAAMICAAADRMRGRMKDVLVMFGRVPFAFYIPHFFLIHALSVGLGLMQGFAVSQMFTVFLFYPGGYGVGLAGVYAAWVLVIATLYPFCRWMATIKARRRDWWLSYV